MDQDNMDRDNMDRDIMDRADMDHGIPAHGHTPVHHEDDPLASESPQPDAQPAEAELLHFAKEDAYRILRSRPPSAAHQTESYDQLLDVFTPQALSEQAPIEVEDAANGLRHVVAFRGVRYDRPCVIEADGTRRNVTPDECHLRRLDYSVGVRVDVSYTIMRRGMVVHSIVFRDLLFDTFPCMVGSSYCWTSERPDMAMLDPGDVGGYTISTGAEKVVVGQEQAPRDNFPFVTENKKTNQWKLEIRSRNTFKIRSTSTLVMLLSPAYVTSHENQRRVCPVSISTTLPYVETTLPLPVLFKLLGVADVESMLPYICTPQDPEWFRQRCLDALHADMAAVTMSMDYIVQQLAHDRSRSVYSPVRARRRQKARDRRKCAPDTPDSPGTPGAPGAPGTPDASDAPDVSDAPGMVSPRPDANTETSSDDDEAGDPGDPAPRTGPTRATAANAADMRTGSPAGSANPTTPRRKRTADTDGGRPAKRAKKTASTAQPAATAQPAPTAQPASTAPPATPETADTHEAHLRRCRRQLANTINTELLPHQGTTDADVPAKVVLIGMAVRKLLSVYYQLLPPDNRDGYASRRVQTCGMMMALLERSWLSQWRRRVAAQMKQEIESGSQFINVQGMLHANIGNKLRTALATGHMGLTMSASTLEGVAQVVSRIEPHSATSHVLRVNNPMNKEARATGPRMQDPSGFGIIDAWDTPEGQACGLMRNMAATAGVRVGYPAAQLIEAVASTGLVHVAARATALGRLDAGAVAVLVNGVLIGTTDDGPHLVERLRALRSAQDIPFDVSIIHVTGASTTPAPTSPASHAASPASPAPSAAAPSEIHVNGDPGSYWWPLIRTDRLADLRRVLDCTPQDDALWPELLAAGVIEAINKDEEAGIRVAFDWHDLRHAPPGTYTHVVIDPVQICSVYSARMPFLGTNQAPRVTYAGSQMKQAIGRPLANARTRVDTTAFHLHYVERPLVSTCMDWMLETSGECSGQNVVVAIMCCADNIEDAIVINGGSLDRGLFRRTKETTVRELVRTDDRNETEELGLPPDGCAGRLDGNYGKIDPATGVIAVGMAVTNGDVLISKFARKRTRIKTTEADANGVLREVDRDVETVRDRSTIYRSAEDAVVDDVIFSNTLSGQRTVRVRVRTVRVPIVGDKFASRYGQKGTIGAVYAPEDMPFTRAGIVPDIIINAHCIPSRMTIGHLLEMLSGKVAAMRGQGIDGTPFNVSDRHRDSTDPDAFVKELGAMLEGHGFHANGTEVMYDGRSGRKLHMPVYIAPMFYQSLKHMTADKSQARARGARSIYTRQPLEGRLRGGGQRFGEMERDNLLAQGASRMVQDRLLVCSDQAVVPVCTQCHRIAQPPRRRAAGHALYAETAAAELPFCKTCLRSDTVSDEVIPYAFKAATQIFDAMHVNAGFMYS